MEFQNGLEDLWWQLHASVFSENLMTSTDVFFSCSFYFSLVNINRNDTPSCVS